MPVRVAQMLLGNYIFFYPTSFPQHSIAGIPSQRPLQESIAAAHHCTKERSKKGGKNDDLVKSNLNVLLFFIVLLMIEVELKPSKTGGHSSVSTRLIIPPSFWSYQVSWNPGIAAGGRTENPA